MCGITGFFSFEKSLHKETLYAMTRSLSHRGPDAEGFFQDEVCSLGHRRLSILDLSARSNQPMASNDGRYICIFNGEVYNYLEVAQQLGISSSTTSDTEIIVEAFALKGPACVHLFNGMFSIAIYDTQKKELYLFKDRMGVKPIFYIWTGHYFAFASEIKTLLKLPFFQKSLNYEAIETFLRLGYIPQPHCIYSGITKMYSGYWIKISKKGLEENLYWDVRNKSLSKPILQEAQALEELHSILRSTIKYRLISDVPVGVLLSGGIDSSLVAALCVEQSEKKVNTFSIGFQESKFNEAVFAHQVAQHLQTNHHEFIVSVNDALEIAPQILDIYDEPFADSSAIPTYLVSRLARQNVTVALGGDGGDELFLGYGMYLWAKRLKSLLVKLFRRPTQALFEITSGQNLSLLKVIDLLNHPSDPAKIPSHIFSIEQGFFSENGLVRLLNFKLCSSDPPLFTQFSDNTDPMFQQSVFDIVHYLQDDLLVKIDRASMQHGLELREPLLDYRLIEFALRLPTSLKYKNGISKYLLKKVLYKYLPAPLFDRPKKGFSIPLAQWLRGELRFMIEDFLNEKNVKSFDLVDYQQVHTLKRNFLEGNDYHFNRIWALVLLHQFMNKIF